MTRPRLPLRSLITTATVLAPARKSRKEKNSQKSRVSRAMGRPHGRHASSSPCVLLSDASESGDEQCMSCRFPNGWQKGWLRATSGHGSQIPNGVQTRPVVLLSAVAAADAHILFVVVSNATLGKLLRVHTVNSSRKVTRARGS